MGQAGTDLDGAASGLRATGAQAHSGSEALSRAQCSSRGLGGLGPEVPASTRGWQRLPGGGQGGWAGCGDRHKTQCTLLNPSLPLHPGGG